MKQRIQFISAILGGLFFIVWMGYATMGGSDLGKWLTASAGIVCLVALIWASFLKDALPDVLGEAGIDYLESDGFCFSLGLHCFDGVPHLVVGYQNRYANRCTAELLCNPKKEHDDLGISTLRIHLECPGGGDGSAHFPWLMEPKKSGELFTCKLGIDVNYPEGKGVQLRSRPGRPASSTDIADAPEIMEVFATASKVRFQIPYGLNETPVLPSSSKPVQNSPATGNETAPPQARIATATARITIVGKREVQVVCEHCAHDYTYTLTREVRTKAEDSNQAEARRIAQKEADEELKNKLATEADVVPCPRCGKLSAQMKKVKMRHRKNGVLGIGVGLGVAFAGALLMLVVYLIEETTHRLFYMLAIMGGGAVLGGFAMAASSLWQSITGRIPEKEASTDSSSGR